MHDSQRVGGVEETMREKVEDVYRYLMAEISQRHSAKSWGKTTVVIGWEDGMMTDLRVLDERTAKVAYKKPKKG